MKNLKKALVLLLVASMCAGTLNLPVFAEEEVVNDSVENANGTVTDITTTTTTETDPVTGDTTVVIEIQKDTTGTTQEGAQISGTENSKETVVTDSEGNLVSGSSTESNTTLQTNPDGSQTASGFTGGSTTTTEGVAPNVTVDVPLTTDDPLTDENEAQEEATGNPAGTVIDQTGVLPGTSEDGSYDYTTNTVVTPGKVTITTEKVTVTEKVTGENTELDYVASETNPTADNDLIQLPEASGGAPEAFQPGYDGEITPPAGVEGYDYVYVGSGNTSKFFPAIVFDKPLSDEDKVAQYGDNAYIKKNSVTYYYVKWLKDEDKQRIAYDESGNYVTDEEGYILDKEGNRILKEERTETGPNGETTYLHRFDNYNSSLKTEGWYEDGEWVVEVNGKGYTAVWGGVQQFVLVDADGNVITAYCADNATPTEMAFGYNVENLEDATYYSEEEAAMIRTIALNGYWGTVGTETDENGNEVPETGSLDAMKQKLLASGKFTEEELASLNDGVAETATQMAIWTCSNKMSGIKFVGSHYSNWGVGDIPEDKEYEVKVLFKLYDYLMSLEPTEVTNTTADTIINEDNFLKDMDITVIEKAEDHINNQNDDDTDDAYVTDIIFSLVVEPSTENGDDLIVKVIGYDEHGVAYEAASGRIAGEAKEGENVLIPDEEGNYKFSGITITEGEKTFNITLEGVQNLDHGVYLYTSEVRDETSSQTLVGLAEGSRAVNVDMSISFTLNVEDEVVATEHVWHTEWEYDIIETEETEEESEEEETDPAEETDPSEETDPTEESDPTEEFEEEYETEVEIVAEVAEEDDTIQISDEDIPLTDIPDEPVPMTNDSIAWYICSVFAAIALFVLTLCDKNKKFNA